MAGRTDPEDSPSRTSQQTVSDDDEIDYSSKPEFYDPAVDDKDELWANKQRGGRTSDAVLSCPACFTTLCLDSQRHEKCVTQYRAMFVVNCKMKEVVAQLGSKRRRDKKGSQPEAGSNAGETFKRVCCSVCSTEVGVIDESELRLIYSRWDFAASEVHRDKCLITHRQDTLELFASGSAAVELFVYWIGFEFL